MSQGTAGRGRAPTLTVSKFFLFPPWLAAGDLSALAAVSTVPTAGQQRPAHHPATASAVAPILLLLGQEACDCSNSELEGKTGKSLRHFKQRIM